MTSIIRQIPLLLFCLGLVVNCILGTGTEMRFQWAGYGLLGLAIALCVVTSRGDLPVQRKLALPCLIATAFAFLYIFWRALNSPVSYLAREDLVLAAIWIASYATVALILNRSADRRAILMALGVVLLINVGFVFWQFGVNSTAWILPGYERTYLERMGGVFNNPNHFAALLAAAIPMLLALAIFDQKKEASLSRILHIAAAAVLMVALYMTQSRGGLIALSCGLGVFAILAIQQIRHFFPERRVVVTIVASISAIAILMVAGSIGRAVLADRFGELSPIASETNRPLIWQGALKQHAESPLIGTGARSFYFYSRKHRAPEMRLSEPEPEFAHNEYLQLLADYGWIGAGLIAGFLALHFAHGLQFLRKREPARQSQRLALTIGAIAGLVALGAHAAFDFGLHTPALAVLSAILCAILVVPGVREESSRDSVPEGVVFRRVRPVLLSGIGALAAFVAVCAMGYGPAEQSYEKARLAFEAGEDSAEPVVLLESVVRRDKHNPFAHSLLGHIALRDGDPTRAATSFVEAIKRYPQDVFARLGLAEALMQQERFELAEDVLEEASVWAPLYGNIRQARGEIALAAGELAKARTHFELAAEATAFADPEAAAEALESLVQLPR